MASCFSFRDETATYVNGDQWDLDAAIVLPYLSLLTLYSHISLVIEQTDGLSYKGTNLSLIAAQWENEYKTNTIGTIESFSQISESKYFQHK